MRGLFVCTGSTQGLRMREGRLAVRAIVVAALSVVLALGSALADDKSTGSSDDIRYEVIKREVQPAFNNLKLWVRLNKATSLDVVRAIGAKLKGAETHKFDRVFIFYYLGDKRAGDYAWAITHYTPNLDAQINGLSDAEEARFSKLEAKPGQAAAL
jgi:hypothetical protein